jgi:hypothetical protein
MHAPHKITPITRKDYILIQLRWIRLVSRIKGIDPLTVAEGYALYLSDEIKRRHIVC